MAQDATRCICGAHLEGNICRNCGIEFKETYPAQIAQQTILSAPVPPTLEEQLALHQVKLAHAQITSAQQQQKIGELEKKHKEKEKLSNELEQRMRANEEALLIAQKKFEQASKELSAYTSTGAKPETILAAQKNLGELGQQIKTLGAQKAELDGVLKNYTRFGLPEKIEQELKARGELEKEKTRLEGTVKAKQKEFVMLGETLGGEINTLKSKAKSLEEVIARDRKYQDEIAPEWAEYVNFAEIALLDFLKDRISKPEFLTAQRRNAIALAGTFASEYWINALKKKNNIDWQYAYKLESNLKQFYDEFKKNPQAYETIECVADIFISAATLLQGLPNKENSADLLMKAIAFPLKYCINVGEELYESRREEVEEKIEKFRSENKIDLELGIIGNTLDEYIDSFEASSVSQPKPATETKPNTIAECIFCGAPLAENAKKCGRCGAVSNLFDNLFKSAVACTDKGNYSDAMKLFDQCIAIKPNNATIWNNKGACLYGLGKLEDALSSYDKAIELNPKYIHAWECKGIVLEKLGRPVDAIMLYRKAIELDASKKSELGSKIEDLYNSLIKKGKELADSKSYADALALFEQCTQIKQNDGNVWNLKGHALNKLGKYTDAIDALDKAIEINPKEDSAWHNKDYALRKLGELEGAVAAAAAIEARIKTLKDDLHMVQAQEAAAWGTGATSIYSNSGQIQKEIKACEKAINKLGHSRKELLQNNTNELKSKITYQQNSHTPALSEDYASLFAQGNLQMHLGDYKVAAFVFEDCTRLRPTDEIAWNNLGFNLYKTNCLKDALKAYDKAIENNPKYALAWKNKGDILVKLSRFDEADTAYKRAVSFGYVNVPVIPRNSRLSKELRDVIEHDVREIVDGKRKTNPLRPNEAKKDDLDELDELLNEIKK